MWDLFRVAAGGVLVHPVRCGGGSVVMVSRILVTGSRAWSDRAQLEWALGAALVFRPIVIVHGGCPTGADAMAAAWAQRAGVEVEAWPADWVRYGRAAGPRRNQAMVDAGARLVLAFLLPGSRGTADCVRRAKAADIPVRRFEAER
ncbi:SLOG family protein [Kitasatospora sp. NPDC094028]